MGLISDGSTIFDAGSISAGFGGSLVFIKKLTASSSGTLSFVHGSSSVIFDDTYKEYVFTFKNIHAATDEASLLFQVDTGSNTSYNTTIQSTRFRALHGEDDGNARVDYQAGEDEQLTTNFQDLAQELGTDNDQSAAGTLTIFNPSSTTFTKHFIANFQNTISSDHSMNTLTAGYFNTTTALNKVQFKMSSGNIDAGDICLYGIA